MQKILLLLLKFCLTSSGDKVVDLIKTAKYPVEVHHVQTLDGINLRLHRIPSGVQKLNYKAFREPVFLMHGISASATTWVLLSPNKSLAYMLADAGYDVWMLNARGTAYSQKFHLNNKKLWDFSFHEIGYYDVPAAIDYVLAKTKQKKVMYIGHSQGCTAFAVTVTTHPNFNEKISAAFLLTPAIFMHHNTGIVKILSIFYKELQLMTDFLKIYGLFIRSDSIYKMLFDIVCQVDVICKEIMFLIFGKDSGQLPESIVTLGINDVIEDISVKQLAHFSQLLYDDRFAMYDYGSVENLIRYKSQKSPEYNLTKIQVPTTIFYGVNDALVNSRDVELFISKLPNLRKSVRLPWNHIDFVFGQDVDVQVNNIIIRGMKLVNHTT